MDCHATTRVDPRVVARMSAYFDRHYGNAASRNHAFGWRADEAVETAREEIAALVGGSSREIVLTSGATEANNLAIKGVVEAYDGAHVITQATEHPSVLDTCRYLEGRGVVLTVLAVDREGRVDPAAVGAAITDRTALVSIMWVNNEIGTVQPVAEIGAVCRARGVPLHVDAAQGAGKLPLDVEAMQIDLASVSAHKMYGPKGVGALFVRRKKPRVNLAPQLHGGGHERGVRSGTVNVPAVVGFGAAAQIARAEMATESERVGAQRDRLWTALHDGIDGVTRNSPAEGVHPGNLNVSFAGVDAEMLLMRLRDLSVSSGAACASASRKPSHVLGAIGVTEAAAHSSLRFGLGRFNTPEETDFAAQTVIEAVRRLREEGPAITMAQP